jgi:hypothetical protein
MEITINQRYADMILGLNPDESDQIDEDATKAEYERRLFAVLRTYFPKPALLRIVWHEGFANPRFWIDGADGPEHDFHVEAALDHVWDMGEFWVDKS